MNKKKIMQNRSIMAMIRNTTKSDYNYAYDIML